MWRGQFNDEVNLTRPNRTGITKTPVAFTTPARLFLNEEVFILFRVEIREAPEKACPPTWSKRFAGHLRRRCLLLPWKKPSQ